MSTSSNQQQLHSYFAPKTLNELMVTGNHLIASVGYHRTLLPQKGLLSTIKNLFGKKVADIDMDLDLSCVTLDKHYNKLDQLWYGNLRAQDDAIRHSGDALVGAQNFEQQLINQEQITLRLPEISNDTRHIALMIHSFNKQPLKSANHGVFELKDNDGNLIHRHAANDLDTQVQAVFAWYLKKLSNDWEVFAPFEVLKNNRIHDIESVISWIKTSNNDD